jgi:hypothetical protein
MKRLLLSALLLLLLLAGLCSAQVSINANPTLDGAAVGQAYSANLFPAGGTPPYNFSVISGAPPPGLGVSPGGVLSGTPTSAGSSTFTVLAQDSAGASAVKQFTLKTAATPLSLAPSAGALPNSTAGQIYQQQFTASGGSGQYTYYFLPPPTWPFGQLDLNPQNGLFFGTALTPGTYSFSVEVIDSDRRVITQSYSLTVLPEPPLALAPCSIPAGVPGANYQAQLIASGGVVPYTFSLTPGAGSPPPGVTLTADGQLRGAIPVNASDAYFFAPKVTDGAGTVIGTQCNLVVNFPTSLTITTSSPLPTAIAGSQYSVTLSAASASAPTGFSWNQVGSLPPGLSLDSLGNLSGAPSTPGNFNLTAQVFQGGTSVQKTFALTVAAQPLTITTPSPLPNALGFRPYLQAIAASSTPVGNLIFLSGALPEGVTFSGQQIIGTPQLIGTYNFTVELDSPDGRAATQTYSLTVSPNGALSITTASPLPVGVVGADYLLPWTATNLAQVSYAWSTTGALPVGLSVNSGGLLAGTPTTAGNFNFTGIVTVTSTSNSATKGLQLNVRAQALTVSTSTLPQGEIGGQYSFTVAAVGGAGSGYTFSGGGTFPPGLSINSTGTISGMPTQLGSFGLTVTVNDSDGSTASRAYTLSVVGPPTLTVPNLPNGTVGAPYPNAQFGATGGIAPYLWLPSSGGLPPGLTLNSGTGVVSGTPTTTGVYTFTVTVQDSAGIGVTSSALHITINPGLTIQQTALPSGTVAIPYTATLNASGGVSPYTWSLSGGALPTGLSLSSSGSITGAPTAAGTSSFTALVTDARGSVAVAQFQITIRSGLTITPATLPPGTALASYRPVQFSANVQGASLSWSISGGAAPPGMILSSNGVLQGTPTQAGVFTFTVATTDFLGNLGSESLTLLINPALAIAPATIPATAMNAPLPAFAFTAVGGTSPYSWTITAGSPAPSVILGSNGTLSGSPTASGTFSFTVTVTDTAGATASAQESMTVTGPSLAVTPMTLPEAAVTVAYTPVNLSATGGKQPYSWSVSSGALPAGMSLSSSGALSGTPVALGTFPFTAQVKDAAGAIATGQFSIIVAAALTITSQTPPAGEVNVAYPQFTFVATGGTAPYTWSWSGNQPRGLMLASGGAVSGTPTQAGTFNLAVQVKDAGGLTANATYSIVIAPALSVVTTSLPAGTVGTAYSQTLAASGGTTPYSWSVAGGALPGGLSMSSAGAVTGTPTAAGSFTFTVRVTDAYGGSVQGQISMTVNLPAVSGLSIQGLPATTSAAQQQPFTITLPSAFPVPLTGLLTLTFTSSAVAPSDDPAIQFTTGGRTLAFTVPANQTTGVFAIPQVAVQTGTVAGSITITASLLAGQADVTPSPSPSVTIVVQPAVPVISSVTVTRTTGGLSIAISGYSTPRQVTSAIFQFTSTNLQTSSFTVDVSSAFSAWYQTAASAAFGSAFLYTQPFTLQGSLGTGSVSVTLTNAQGTSAAASAQF